MDEPVLAGIIIGSLGLIFGCIALIMATPTLAQMFWGRPEIEFEFTASETHNAKFLECYITNSPVTKRLLKFLGVHRETAVDVWGMYEISEIGTGRVVLPATNAKFTGRNGEAGSSHVSISSGTIGRKFGVVFLSPDDQKVKVLDEPNTILGIGIYSVYIRIMAAERLKRATRKFTVHQDGSLFWEP